MSEESEKALAHLTEMVAAYRRAESRLDEAREARDDAMTWCIEVGVPNPTVARTAGVSRGRVTHIAPKNHRDDTESPEKNDTDLRVSENLQVDLSTNRQVDTSIYRLVDSMKVVSEYVTKRDSRRVFSRRDDTRAAAWAPLANLCNRMVQLTDPASSMRLLVCGQPTGDLPASEAVRAWALDSPGDGWEVVSAYVRDPELPVIRLKGPEDRELVVMRAGTWFGSNNLEQGEVDKAWRALTIVVSDAFKGGRLGDTPATTGRQLWLSSIGRDAEYPVASAEIRDLIQTTSGQGRIELLEPRQETAKAFTQYDGRLMYAAHTWGLGVGDPELVTHDAIGAMSDDEMQRAYRGRGWWHVTATVPDDWSHVGTLPHPREKGWEYPSEPGRTFSTWCDGSEVYGALAAGWKVEPLEMIRWNEGKPLNTWRDKIVQAWEKAPNELVRKALRSMLLFSIGAFAARQYPVSKSLPEERAAEVPREAIPGTVTRVDDRIVWQEQGATTAWQESTRHPEWAACVWGRTRAVMARRALAEPRENVIAFATDALYVAAPGHSFGADTGKVGELRIKGSIESGPVPMPKSYAELYALRDQAETEWEARA